jgi:hypothetical protein
MTPQSLAGFGFGYVASLRAMELGDAAKALQAKADLARRHAEELRAQAVRQRARAAEQRAAEQRAVEAARRGLRLEEPVLTCTRCGAVWRREAIAEATRRRPGCLLCGGGLAPVP